MRSCLDFQVALSASDPVADARLGHHLLPSRRRRRLRVARAGERRGAPDGLRGPDIRCEQAQGDRPYGQSRRRGRRRPSDDDRQENADQAMPAMPILEQGARALRRHGSPCAHPRSGRWAGVPHGQRATSSDGPRDPREPKPSRGLARPFAHSLPKRVCSRMLRSVVCGLPGSLCNVSRRPAQPLSRGASAGSRRPCSP